MKYTLIIGLALLGVANTINAQSVKELEEFTREKVSQLSKALNETSQSLEPGGFEDWDFRRFLLRVQAKAAFDIELFKIELVPELELVWQKSIKS